MPAGRDDGGWWNEARRDARALRARLSAGQTGEISADALLERAALAANLQVRARPEGDPLLCGAHAVLDPEDEAIWVRASATKPERRLFVAHELAHFFLHGGQNGDLWQAGCFGDVSGDDDGLLVTVGYGPAQRRETEANVWAREFLLPAHAAQAGFTNGETALQITRRVGLTLATVYTQLTAALTDPMSPPEISVAADETVAAPLDPPPPLTLDPTQEKAARTPRRPDADARGAGDGQNAHPCCPCFVFNRGAKSAPGKYFGADLRTKSGGRTAGAHRLVRAGNRPPHFYQHLPCLRLRPFATVRAGSGPSGSPVSD